MYVHGRLAILMKYKNNATDVYEMLQQVRGEEIKYKPKYKTLASIFFKYID